MQLTQAEIDVLRPAEGLTLSQWAERYRVLDELNAAEAGPWRNVRTPYLVGIMDALTDRRVTEVTVVKAVQMGMSEVALNLVGYAIDQDPGPIMLVYPRQSDCEYFSERRIKAMIDACPRVAGQHTGWKRDYKKMEIGFARATLYMAASTSPADVSSKPIRYLIMDELDRFETWTAGEGSPLALARDRTTTFWNRKILKLSTPTTRHGHILSEFERSDKRRYWCPCPRCRAYQVLMWSQVKVPPDQRDPDRIRNDALATYECLHCGFAIPDRGPDREMMIRRGVWAPEGASVTADGRVEGGRYRRHAGFHMSALVSPWVSWSDLAAEFFEAKAEPAKLQVWVNQKLAEAWEESAVETSETKLRERCLPYRRGAWPAAASWCTIGVDVQQGYFRWACYAWAAPSMEGWLIDYGRCETWADLVARVVNGEWEGHKARLIGIDAGYDTWSVYDFVLRFPDCCRAMKGSARPLNAPFLGHKIERHRVTGQVLPGLMLWSINTEFYKDRWVRMTQAVTDEVAGWHIPEDVGDEFLAELAAERKVYVRRPKGGGGYCWLPKWDGAPNHYLDCTVYAMACADMLIDPASRPGGVPRPAPAPRPRPEGGWNPRRRPFRPHGFRER
jgi:phage terminase large subunit GpA-like protein